MQRESARVVARRLATITGLSRSDAMTAVLAFANLARSGSNASGAVPGRLLGPLQMHHFVPPGSRWRVGHQRRMLIHWLRHRRGHRFNGRIDGAH
jgi:hypothetical protein